jgi:hypothetical protein
VYIFEALANQSFLLQGRSDLLFLLQNKTAMQNSQRKLEELHRSLNSN